ncbi:MAG: MerR family transcriptional regulator [Burkholderiales bacterium]|nr:MerR family DNA-binding transcriptional regulator [Burkholderiales bacterium]MDQ3195239.1 MerR family DNA-binding transcriptional regulator [Pseudomonadota bacterium]
MKTRYTISELAREFDITLRTIRFYEDQGLLTPAREGRNRVYSRRDRVRLKLTLRGKRLGFALSEVRELFELYDSARNEKPQLMQFLLILEQRRVQLERQRGEIDAMLVEIRASENQCRSILDEANQLAPMAMATGIRK